MATTAQVDGPAGRNAEPGKTCVPATQWTGYRLLFEYCCGLQSRIGPPMNFVDDSCVVIRYTEKEDMRTDEGL
eukprot:3770150-Pyramimonas_sp.AAC.1